MKKDNSKNIILDYQDVENKIKRISLEILEDNIDQKKLILFGVSKSGSPAPKPITSFPAALISLAFEVTAIVGDGFIRFKLLETMLIEIYNIINLLLTQNAKYLSRKIGWPRS